ncbi:MAG: 23S rRNA (guanosine(2251)-2'-O)-methyltransferase RlmB, partial [Hyphomicrobiales bacterium]
MTDRRNDGRPPQGRPHRPGSRPGHRPFSAGSRRDAGGRAGNQAGADGSAVLYGWHPVVQALGNAARGLHRLLATENAAARLEAEFGGALR